MTFMAVWERDSDDRDVHLFDFYSTKTHVCLGNESMLYLPSILQRF